LRRSRFRRFSRLLEKRFPGQKLNILDVGGWEGFWELMNFADTGHRITLLNIEPQKVSRSNFRAVIGDARDLRQFGNQEFDVVFSNSVIEHVGSFEDQKKMAVEICRVGRSYFVQTPNFFFPFEPHFLFPMFHWLPMFARIALLRRFRLGYYARASSRSDALQAINSIRLLRSSEVRSLFPEARIARERFLGWTKSLIAVKF